MAALLSHHLATETVQDPRDEHDDGSRTLREMFREAVMHELRHRQPSDIHAPHHVDALSRQHQTGVSRQRAIPPTLVMRDP